MVLANPPVAGRQRPTADAERSLQGTKPVALLSAGCAIVEGVFKAGLWVGAILVLLVVAVVVWILRKMRR
jgi:hypothetical protein